MGNCSFPGCSNRSQPLIRVQRCGVKSFRLFRFPKNEYRRNQWLELCQLRHAPDHAVLCEGHFTIGQFEVRDYAGNLSLSRNAVPDILMPNPPLLKDKYDLKSVTVSNPNSLNLQASCDNKMRTEVHSNDVYLNNCIPSGCKTLSAKSAAAARSKMKTLSKNENSANVQTRNECVPKLLERDTPNNANSNYAKTVKYVVIRKGAPAANKAVVPKILTLTNNKNSIHVKTACLSNSAAEKSESQTSANAHKVNLDASNSQNCLVLSSDITSLREQVADLTAHNTLMSDMVQRCESSKQALKAELRKLRTKLRESERARSSLKRNLDQLLNADQLAVLQNDHPSTNSIVWSEDTLKKARRMQQLLGIRKYKLLRKEEHFPLPSYSTLCRRYPNLSIAGKKKKELSDTSVVETDGLQKVAEEKEKTPKDDSIEETENLQNVVC